MLPKNNRLSKHGVSRVFISRKALYKSSLFTVFYQPPQETAVPKFAVSVGKTVSKKAVERNRIRRLLYRIIGAQLCQFPPGQFVLTVKKAAQTKVVEEFEKEIQKAINYIPKAFAK